MRPAAIFGVILVGISLSAAIVGCFGDGQAKDKVNQARDLIANSQPLLQDLTTLDARFNSLGTRFSKVEDTIAEGKSLASMAMIDVDELESRYSETRDLLNETININSAGDYADYSRLALQAVESKLQEIGLNRELLSRQWKVSCKRSASTGNCLPPSPICSTSFPWPRTRNSYLITLRE